MRGMVGSAGSVAAVAAALVLATGCGGGDSKTVTGSGTPSPTATAQQSTAQPSSTEQTSPPLTKSQLTSALITAKDLPTGYKVTPAGGDEGDTMTGDAGCQKIDAIDGGLRKGSQPSQVAYASLSFINADESGGGDETLASFATEAAAGKGFSEYAAAADACRSLGLKVDPATTVKLTGSPLSMATVGDESRAYRYLGRVQGVIFWMDAVVFRTGSTLALLSVGRLGSAPQSGLLQQIATKAAAKLA